MINLVSIYSAVFRAAEIAVCGRHSLCLIPAKNRDNKVPSEKDIFRLKNEIYLMYSSVSDRNQVDGDKTPYDIWSIFYDSPEADMLIETNVPDGLRVIRAMHSRDETILDIAARIRKFIDAEKPEIDTRLTGASENLLKQAIDKLSLRLSDVESVLSVARTIAQMSGSDSIKPEHIAEAIQYKSITVA